MKQVINIQKLKDDKEITQITSHNLRITTSDNVDSKKTRLNKMLFGGTQKPIIELLNEKLATVPKFRKDAVKVVNLVLSASPEFYQDKEKVKQWEIETQKFLEDTFGKENILYSVVHYDEKTPHFHCSIVPIVNGKLNCSHYFDGAIKLKKFHDLYNKRIKHLGIARGDTRQKAKQQDLSDYYVKVNASAKYEKDLDNKIDIAFEKIEQRLNNPSLIERFNSYKVVKELKPVFQSLVKSISHYRTKSKENSKLKKEVQKLSQRVEDLELKFDNMGLSPDMPFSQATSLKDKIALATNPPFFKKDAPATEPIIEENKNQLSKIVKFRPK